MKSWMKFGLVQFIFSELFLRLGPKFFQWRYDMFVDL